MYMPEREDVRGDGKSDQYVHQAAQAASCRDATMGAAQAASPSDALTEVAKPFSFGHSLSSGDLAGSGTASRSARWPDSKNAMPDEGVLGAHQTLHPPGHTQQTTPAHGPAASSPRQPHVQKHHTTQCSHPTMCLHTRLSKFRGPPTPTPRMGEGAIFGPFLEPTLG